MSKPKTTDEAHLRRKFKQEETIPYETDREVREGKRVWKRKTSKLGRKQAKEQIRRAIEGEDE